MSDPAAIRSSRREAVFTAIVWILFCTYVTVHAAWFAYGGNSQPRLIWGMPAWVVTGVIAPWAAATVLTLWYALGRMRDEDLGGDEEAAHG